MRLFFFSSFVVVKVRVSVIVRGKFLGIVIMMMVIVMMKIFIKNEVFLVGD